MLTGNEEDDPPLPAPLAQPSGPAPTVETLPLWLRCHPPALPLPSRRSPPSHHGGIPVAQPSRPGRSRPHRRATAAAPSRHSPTPHRRRRLGWNRTARLRRARSHPAGRTHPLPPCPRRRSASSPVPLPAAMPLLFPAATPLPLPAALPPPMVRASSHAGEAGSEGGSGSGRRPPLCAVGTSCPSSRRAARRRPRRTHARRRPAGGAVSGGRCRIRRLAPEKSSHRAPPTAASRTMRCSASCVEEDLRRLDFPAATFPAGRAVSGGGEASREVGRGGGAVG